MEELLNCVQEICCEQPVAQAALLEMFKRGKCHTPDDCARLIFEYFTLADRSFVEVKKKIAALARQP